MPAIERKTVFEQMEALAACLCAQIKSDNADVPCFCGVLPGASALGYYITDCQDDAEDCGMAWVRLATAFSSDRVGQPNLSVGNCGMETGLAIEIGIERCFVIPDKDGPHASELLKSAEQQIKDMMTMKRALVCCEAFSSKDWILGNYNPTGPIGGFVGGFWTIYLNVT